MIVIVDYGMGNLGSILNMLIRIGADGMISSDPGDIKRADKLILPGVGAFDAGMRHLNERNLIEPLNDKVLKDKTQTLGICLGMQLLMEYSAEGKLPGLGWIKGKSVRFQADRAAEKLRIPHMGWNTVEILDSIGLFHGLEEEARFYFVHSYHVICDDQADVLALTHYGYDFHAACHHENIQGTQFHPEKSHKFGMKLLQNFVERF